MAEYPLLLFPEPAHIERARRYGGGSGIRPPDVRRQAERLTPQFEQLQDALEQKRLALQNNPVGIRPEQVLVIETIGSIENFINAVKRIKGLEWLGEFELEDITPDYGFEDTKDPQKQLKGQLFLVMTNQRAQQEIVSLFNRCKKDQDTEFPYGLAKLKRVFVYLHTIRTWDVEDRIRETGILEDWEDRLQHDNQTVPFEVELWYRDSLVRRQQAQSQLRNIIASLGGQVVQQCTIPDIAYHAILGTIPIALVQKIVEQPEVRQSLRLLQCEDIMYLRPVGQCAIRVPVDMTETDTLEEERQPELPQGDPIVALLGWLAPDGTPVTRWAVDH